MYFYLVEKIGDGTKKSPFRPNYPYSVFSWDPEKVCPHCNLYVIALPEQTTLLQPVADLEAACFARNLAVSDVVNWFVGDEP